MAYYIYVRVTESMRKLHDAGLVDAKRYSGVGTTGAPGTGAPVEFLANVKTYSPHRMTARARAPSAIRAAAALGGIVYVLKVRSRSVVAEVKCGNMGHLFYGLV